jgi:hypothetical protein
VQDQLKKKTQDTQPSYADTQPAPYVPNNPPQVDMEVLNNEVPPQAVDTNPENLRSKTDIFGIPEVSSNNNNNDLPTFSFSNTVNGAQDDLFGNVDNLQKQINQFSSDLAQVPQDVFGLGNFGSQNPPNGTNQNYLWNK